MKAIIHKDLTMYEYTGVIQVSVNVSEEIDTLEMPQETIIHIIQGDNNKKTKTAILCDTNIIMTIIEDKLK